MEIIVKFVRNYPSYFWLFLSTVFMGFFFHDGLWPVLVHFLNLGILLFVRYEARRAENYFMTVIGLFLSLGLTAVMLYPPSWWHAGVLGVNFVMLLAMCNYAKTDIANVPQKA